MYTVAQIVGFLGVATFLLSYQLKRRKNIILVNSISSFLYVLQYLLLGAFEGAAIDVLSGVLSVVAHNKNKGFIKKYTRFIACFFALLIFAAGMVLYKNVFSLFPIIGAILQTSAFWIESEKRIRQVSLLGAPFWLVYNLVSHAYGATLGSFLSIVSIGLAIYRYDIYTKRVTKQEKGFLTEEKAT